MFDPSGFGSIIRPFLSCLLTGTNMEDFFTISPPESVALTFSHGPLELHMHSIIVELAL